MGLAYKTSTWLDRLWAEHLQASAHARDLVADGMNKQGNAFAGFPADVHARLYLPKDPDPITDAPEWAVRLHEHATETSEWQRLRAMCARNGFAAGVAAEALLRELLPHVPDQPTTDRPASGGTAPSAEGQPTPGSPAGQTAERQEGTSNSQATSPDAAELRAALRRAARAARDAVSEAEAQLDGLGTPLGLPGTNVVRSAGPAELKAIRDAHQRLQGSKRLARIAALAGRLERVATNKTRSKVKPGVGEIHGIGLGGDIARLLPSELVIMRRKWTRLALLSRLLQDQALVYGMTGREPQARGPIIVVLDESSSMREAGKDIWSKAVALALLSTATKQRRAWHLVAFNGAITREMAFAPGRATAADIQAALDHKCAGGTDFDAPINRAIHIIKSSKTMRQADVIVITDGEDDLEPATIEAANELTRAEGVTWYVIGVGFDAKQCAHSLGPIATSISIVTNTADIETISPVINLENAA